MRCWMSCLACMWYADCSCVYSKSGASQLGWSIKTARRTGSIRLQHANLAWHVEWRMSHNFSVISASARLHGSLSANSPCTAGLQRRYYEEAAIYQGHWYGIDTSICYWRFILILRHIVVCTFCRVVYYHGTEIPCPMTDLYRSACIAVRNLVLSEACAGWFVKALYLFLKATKARQLHQR